MLSALTSNEAPVLVPLECGIRMVLRVGTVLIGAETYEVLCRDTTHAWQAQLADASKTMLLGSSVEDAVERLLVAAHVRRGKK